MNAKGKKFVSLFLVFSLLALSSNLMAKERRGADLLIQKTDGQQVGGELIAVKQNSLLLKDSESGADVSVDIKDIKVVKIVKKSKALICGAAGLLLGTAILVATNQESVSTALQEGGVSTALICVGIGAMIGKDKTILIEEMSDTEIKEALEKLRKKARIRNFQ